MNDHHEQDYKNICRTKKARRSRVDSVYHRGRSRSRYDSQDHARARAGRRRLHRARHPFFRSDRRRSDHSALVRTCAQKTGFIAGGFSAGSRVSRRLRRAGRSFRLLQSDFLLWRQKICPASSRGWRRRSPLRRSAAGRERRVATLDGRGRARSDLFVIADQRIGAHPSGGAKRPRLYLLCLGHRGNRRAPLAG